MRRGAVTIKLAVRLFLSYIFKRCTYYNDDDADVDYYVDVCIFYKGTAPRDFRPLFFFSIDYK